MDRITEWNNDVNPLFGLSSVVDVVHVFHLLTFTTSLNKVFKIKAQWRVFYDSLEKATAHVQNQECDTWLKNPVLASHVNTTVREEEVEVSFSLVVELNTLFFMW